MAQSLLGRVCMKPYNQDRWAQTGAVHHYSNHNTLHISAADHTTSTAAASIAIQIKIYHDDVENSALRPASLLCSHELDS